ncbi:MAG: glycosyltransferase family 9 protein [Mariprofundaceae bacterium]|nr:glycosyltransferase family 9 protein [Mariprofundaceae bacterium]
MVLATAVKKALIVPYRYLGDTLFASPLAKALKKDGYRVEWLVHDGSESILEGQSFSDQVHVLTHDNTARLTYALWQQFELAFAVSGTDRLTAIARLAAKKVYSTLTPERFSDAWKRKLVTAWQPLSPHTHTMQYIQGLIKLAGLSPCWNAGISWQEADEKSSLIAAGVVGKKYIHIHPFSRVEYKYWPDHCWQVLVQMILAYGFDVVVTGASSDEDKAREYFEKIDDSSCNNHIHLCCGLLSWRQLAALSGKSSAYIGVDTANTHLAAATGCPVLALFGPTDPRLWGPWPAMHQGDCPWQAATPTGVQQQGNIVLVQARMACVPCQQEGCNKTGRSACLEKIEANRVWSLCLEKIHE